MFNKINSLRNILLFSVLSLVGCSGYSILGGPGPLVNPSLIAQSESPRDLLTVNSVLVVPVHVDRGVQLSSSERAEFHRSLVQAFTEDAGIGVRSDDKKFTQLKGFETPIEVSQAIQMARNDGIDGVLVTQVHQYVPTGGGEESTGHGARVDLRQQVLRVQDGKVVWEASYFFQDQALSENLLKLNQRVKSGSGMRWKRADALIQEAFVSSAKDFSTKRQAQFVR